MLDLSEFKKKNLNNDDPSLSITEAGVTCNKYCLSKLGYPEKVSLYLDDERHRLVIKKDEEGDVNFVSSKRVNAQYVRWNNNDFRDELLSWALMYDPNISIFTGVKVIGAYLPEDEALLFEFKNAKPNRNNDITGLI